MQRNIPRRDFLKAAPLAVAGALNTNARAAEPAPGTIREPARDVKIAHECDICVVGGSCTGVFAAVAAARLGAKVALIESSGFFGGVATAGLVNIWHSLSDRSEKQQIIAGLTLETIERLRKRDAVRKIERKGQQHHFYLHTEMLKLELDRMVTEARVRPFLHTLFVAPVAEGGRMTAAIIEDKTGRRAIKAKLFLDATGDGDVAHRMGLETYRREHVQPPTTCCVLRGLNAIKKAHPEFNIHKVIFDKKYPQAIRDGYAWSAAVPGDCGCPPDAPVPGSDDLLMLAGTRVHGADCSDADQLTRAEMEGRRQVNAICELLQEHFLGGKGVPLVALPAKIGIRESRHVRALHQLTVDEVLTGKRFPDAVANGTYPVDVHSASGAGIKIRELNKDVEFYQVPYTSLVPRAAKNVLVAGRSLDADEQAFGGVRVMVNCNQTGEAAGTAAWLALDSSADVAAVDMTRLRATLKKHGAAVI
jgi:hypothetical protein